MGLGPISVSVNMSPVQFRRRTAPLHVARVLASTGLDPRLLDIELTEGIVMSGLESVAADMRHLIDIGVSLSIDDFGTGYSSLSYVKYLPVTRLKIDQSFIRNLPTDPSDAAIVRAIVTLGHSLNLSVLAEGVETTEQFTKLRSEGCDQVQGYLFGRPAPLEDFMRLASGSFGLARSA
jgi:EAL domain-containing protein (putative c-di-GMP-specific phosphodiesterase class I)